MHYQSVADLIHDAILPLTSSDARSVADDLAAKLIGLTVEGPIPAPEGCCPQCLRPYPSEDDTGEGERC